jgi:uncharacterized protein
MWTPEIQREIVRIGNLDRVGGLLFFEYIFQVPANGLGAQTFTVTHLKIMQECITLLVFTLTAYMVFGEPLKWNNFVLMC